MLLVVDQFEVAGLYAAAINTFVVLTGRVSSGQTAWEARATMESNQTQLPVPPQDERTLAMLAHVLQLFAGFVAPLVILIIKRQSRFVAFHAAQALLWQAIYFVVMMLTVGVWFAVIFSTLLIHSRPGPTANAPPAAFLVAFPLIFLFLFGGWATGLTLAIVYGIKASHGEWAKYPLVGRWAWRLTVERGPAAPYPAT